MGSSSGKDTFFEGIKTYFTTEHQRLSLLITKGLHFVIHCISHEDIPISTVEELGFKESIRLLTRINLEQSVSYFCRIEIFAPVFVRSTSDVIYQVFGFDIPPSAELFLVGCVLIIGRRLLSRGTSSKEGTSSKDIEDEE